MISRLHIQGFKSLADTTVDLGAVNVFIGANGSGKSNLLEAVGVLSAVVSGHLDTEALRYRGIRTGHPASFCSSFIGNQTKSISIEITDMKMDYSTVVAPHEKSALKWKIIAETLYHDGAKLIERTSDAIVFTEDVLTMSSSNNSLSLINFLATINTIYKNSVFIHTYKETFEVLSEFAIFSPSTPQLRGSLEDIQRQPLGLGGSGLGRAINEMAKADPEMLGPFDIDDVYELIDWAEGIETDSPDPSSFMNTDTPARLRIRDRYMGGAHKSVSATEASEGALYVLFMLALVGHPESPRMFGVDNFDQSLHPNLACALTRMVADQIVKDGTRQMLATTHNPLVLDGLNLLDDRIRLFAVERDSTGSTQVNRVMVTPELMAQAEDGLSLSQLWVMGRLGGVPKNL